MTLYEKINAFYTDLSIEDFMPAPLGKGYIKLANDGAGDYIKEWNHPTLSRPTKEQLDAIKE